MATLNIEAIRRGAARSLDQTTILGGKLRDAFSQEQAIARKRNLKRWYREGGTYFADWSERWYRRPPDGIPISWDEPYLRPLYLCMGNPWVEYLVIQKPAQVFFSETLVNFAAFALAELRSPGGMGFEREAKLRDMVGPRIQTAFDFVQPILDIKRRKLETTGRADTDLKSRVLTVGGATLTFFYASTSKTAGGAQRQASSSISSWTGYVMLCDEIELWPEGVIDVAKSRQLSFKAPTYPTRPFRAGSTPGHEGGVTDREIKTCDRLFQWQVTCPHCGESQILDVFGNFLKPVHDAAEGDRYLSATGRPLSWFCRDDTDSLTRQRTAYVGCQHCGGELDWDARSHGHYRCTYTGEAMEPLLERLCRDREVLGRAGLEITPLSSSRFGAPAAILALLQSRNPADTVQQLLGKPVSLGSGKIQLTMVQRAIARPVPPMERDRTLTVIGADQGREGHWAVATRWHLPIAASFEESWRSAFVEVLECAQLHGFEGIEAWRSRFDADLVGLDFKPEVTLAADYARQRATDLQPAPAQPFVAMPDGSYRVTLDHAAIAADWLAGLGWQLRDQGDHFRLTPIAGAAKPIKAIARQGRRVCNLQFIDAKPARSPGRMIYLFDQCALKGEPFRRSTRNVQGQEIPVWALHRTFGLDAVRDRVLGDRLSLPDGTIYNPADPGNPILHLLTSDRAPNGQWIEAPGQPDHYFHALNFAEMAVLCSDHEPSPGGHFAIATLGR